LPSNVERSLVANVALVILAIGIAVPNLTAYRAFRRTDYRCSEYSQAIWIIYANDGFCRNHILLSTAIAEDQFLVRSIK
jgi:hypothetical protein